MTEIKWRLFNYIKKFVTNMAKQKPKKVSMAKVARTYRKNRTASKVSYDGARSFDQFGQDSAVSSITPGKNTYKPKAKSQTLGGVRKGKGVTIKRKGTI